MLQVLHGANADTVSLTSVHSHSYGDLSRGGPVQSSVRHVNLLLCYGSMGIFVKYIIVKTGTISTVSGNHMKC